MFERFIRCMLSADLGDGGGGGDVGPTVATGEGAVDAPTPEAAPPATPAAAAPAAAPQQQGPDWNSLGVPFDQAQQRLQYFNELEQRYKSDPAWAQKYDQLYGGQQQQAQPHPYDHLNADEKRLAELREKGEQHPDHPRLVQEFTNFFQNQVGHMAQLVNHPKIAEASFNAVAPMVQDLVGRMLQQQLAPMQQFVNRMGEQQFRQQYGDKWAKLPDSIKQMAQEGIFGDWNNNRNQAIIAAVKAGQRLAAQQQQAVVTPEGQQPPQAAKPPDRPAPKTEEKKTPSNSNGKRWTNDDEEFAKKYAGALSGKKT